VLGSNLDRATGCTDWGLLWLSSVSLYKFWDCTSIRPQPLPAISFLICQLSRHPTLYNTYTVRLEITDLDLFLTSSSVNFSPLWNPKFYYVLTSHHWPLIRVNWIQFIHSHPICLWYILILSSYLHVDFQNRVFPPGSLNKTLRTFFISSRTCYIPGQFYSPWFNRSHNTWYSVQIMQFSPLPQYFLSLGARFSLALLLPNALNLHPPCGVTDLFSNQLITYKSLVKCSEVTIFLKVMTKFVWIVFSWYRVQISARGKVILTAILRDFLQFSQTNAGRPRPLPSIFIRIHHSLSLNPTL
jgi:hypothetical protein